jgi:hypothetical protein
MSFIAPGNPCCQRRMCATVKETNFSIFYSSPSAAAADDNDEQLVPDHIPQTIFEWVQKEHRSGVSIVSSVLRKDNRKI